jgi:hypothetical protein
MSYQIDELFGLFARHILDVCLVLFLGPLKSKTKIIDFIFKRSKIASLCIFRETDKVTFF